MTDHNIEEDIINPPGPEDPKAPTTMAEIENPDQQNQTQINKSEKKINFSFSIWPPSQRTRDAVVTRLIETLSSPSVLSKRYGSMSSDEADAVARRIEEEAFSSSAAAASADDDGIEILQVYSKEISKRMLDSVKSRSAPEQSSVAVDPTPADSEENSNSTVKTE